jgi:hypothetical protein
MFKYLLPLSLMLAVTQVEAAENKGGLFVEPMLTYERGDGEVNFPSPINSSDTDVDGFGAGARIGFHIFESVFLAADGRYSLPQFKDSGLDQKTDAKAWNYGPVLGVQMPWDIGLRLWGGYVMGGELDPDKDNNVDVKFKDARGYRLGAGLKLGIASLNLEYQDLTYDKTELESVGPFSSGRDFNKVELDNSSWILSVSFPISI